MNLDMNENKQVIALLGAGSMGLAIIRKFADGKKIVLGDISEEKLAKTKKELEYNGYDAETFVVNACEKESVESYAQYCGDCQVKCVSIFNLSRMEYFSTRDFWL